MTARQEARLLEQGGMSVDEIVLYTFMDGVHCRVSGSARG